MHTVFTKKNTCTYYVDYELVWSRGFERKGGDVGTSTLFITRVNSHDSNDLFLRIGNSYDYGTNSTGLGYGSRPIVSRKYGIWNTRSCTVIFEMLNPR